jgi:hypothetical protein
LDLSARIAEKEFLHGSSGWTGLGKGNGKKEK